MRDAETRAEELYNILFVCTVFGPIRKVEVGQSDESSKAAWGQSNEMEKKRRDECRLAQNSRNWSGKMLKNRMKKTEPEFLNF
jgi:hypothetical protein